MLFFFNDTATTEIYTLSLHDALPISGAYIARRIAIDYLKRYKVNEVLVKLAYAIGRKEPVMARAIIDDEEKDILDYDLTPQGIIATLQLRQLIYTKTSQWGHFGNDFLWDV